MKPGDSRPGQPAEGAKSVPSPQLAKAAAAPAPRGMIYTVTAAQGANTADLINAGMAKRIVGKATPRKVVVAAPDGPSTSGGKRARQTITLVPVSGQGGTVMCGWLDVAQRAAGLRDYRTVAEQYKSRYGSALDVSGEEYLGIIRELETLFKALQVNATHEVAEPVKKAAAVAKAMVALEPEPEPPKPLLLAITGVLIVVAAVVAVLLLLR